MATDWYQQFQSDGYAVIPSVINREAAKSYQTRAFEWLKSLDNPDLDFTNPSTWTPENLPSISAINTFNHYGVVHERFMWDLRLESKIRGVFERIWNTDELLVSFDALNITLPRRPGHVAREKWPHIDQSPYRSGLECVQGVVTLSEAGPDDGGLTVWPGTHKVTEEFFQRHTDRKNWEMKDFYKYSPEQLAWFENKGYREQKVTAAPGDLIIWDSRLIHYGAEQKETSNVIRTAVYVSYAPRLFATEESLGVKREAFEKFLATTHWPHDNITLRSNFPVLENGVADVRRSQPREKPVMSDDLLRLAGVLPY